MNSAYRAVHEMTGKAIIAVYSRRSPEVFILAGDVLPAESKA
jgi:hypothetical protein